MFARYSSNYRILVAGMAFLAGSLSLRAQQQYISGDTVNGPLTVEGNTILHGTLDVGTQALPQGVTIHGGTDIFGNIFTLGHSLDASTAGLEIYIKDINSMLRFIEQVTTLDGTTFRWGTKSATSNDLGTEWMSLSGSTLTLAGGAFYGFSRNRCGRMEAVSLKKSLLY